MQCCFCESEVESLIDLCKFPLEPYPLLNINEIYRQNVSFMFCHSCSHGFLSQFPPARVLDNFYKKTYESYTTVSDMGNIQDKNHLTALDFILNQLEMMDADLDIVEVGGYDGHVLQFLESNSNKVGSSTLIEPNHRGASLGKISGLKVINEFLSDELCSQSDLKFDLV